MVNHVPARLGALCAGLFLVAPAAAQSQGPIHLVFDLHTDPIPNGISNQAKISLYQERVDNISWVLDRTEPLGVKVSYLSAGQFVELLVGEGPGGSGAAVLQRLYQSGGQIGSHQHREYRAGTLDWPDLPLGADLDQERGSWQDNVDWVDLAITTAYGGSPPEALELINCVRGAHVPGNEPDYHTLMGEFGFEIREPGPEEDYYGFYEHHIWHPFRPSPTNAMGEDLGAGFVQVVQGSVIGKEQIHHGVYQDMTAEAIKRQFLQLYVNWRHADRTGQPEKVWCWGWGSHAHDFDVGSVSRPALVDVLAWLELHFANRVEPTGSPVMEWDSHRGTGEAFFAWEAAHAGVSSFSCDSLAVDWGEYPWLRPVAEELGGFRWVADLTIAPGVYAFHLAEGADDAVLCWRDTGSSNVDLSSWVGPTVRIVGLETGALHGDDPTSVDVGVEPLLVTEQDPDCPAPENFCAGLPNSVGAGASISSAGSTSLAAGDFALTVAGGVPGQFALFFYGPNQISIPFGEGLRCVGGGIFRLGPPLTFDTGGTLTRPVDFDAPPANGGPGEIEAGDTWQFQLWYRDPAGGGSGFNLSDGLRVLFCF